MAQPLGPVPGLPGLGLSEARAQWLADLLHQFLHLTLLSLRQY